MKQQTITIKVTYDDNMDEAATWDWSDLVRTQVDILDYSEVTDGVGNKYIVTSAMPTGLSINTWYATSFTKAIERHLEKYPDDTIVCVELADSEYKRRLSHENQRLRDRLHDLDVKIKQECSELARKEAEYGRLDYADGILDGGRAARRVLGEE